MPMRPVALIFWSALAMTLTNTGCATTNSGTDSLLPDLAPPMAEARPHAMTIHGITRDDPWYWLRDDDRADTDMLDYLKAENSYRDAALAPRAELKTRLFEELKGRVKKDDASVPVKDGGYWYQSTYTKGQEYAVHIRREGTLDAAPVVILDQNARAEGHEFFSIGGMVVSHDEQRLAWSEDLVSRRKYTIHVKDLRTGTVLADAIENTSGGIAWAADNETLFYVRKDETTLRPFQVWRHRLGTPASADVLVHQEDDEAYYVGVGTTKSKAFVVIGLESTLVTETLILDATTPEGDFRPVVPRSPDHEYDIAHHGDSFYIRTNWNAPNFRLMKAPVATSQDRATWTEIIPHRNNALLTDIEVFDRWLVIGERVQALCNIRVRPMDGSPEHTIAFDEDLFVAEIDNNPSFDTDTLRFSYESPLTPPSIYDYDLKARTRELKKQDEIMGGYDAADYAMARVWAPARDGAKVPVSLVWKRDVARDGTAPLYHYAYGSYGYSLEPWFSASRLSLMDRGVVIATAHIRGGQEMGRAWYDEGKMEHKMNTFTDFVDVTDHLIKEGWAAPDRVVAAGGSAGGLLMGVIMNLRPTLYRGIHAAVPFVDVLTTMLDAGIPLTTNEYDQWGNPNERRWYDVMATYSPYDNIVAGPVPNLLVTTGLHDSQVQYWEPAKWVAKLRAMASNTPLIVLHTDLEVGHGGQSGRFKRFEDTALAYAFLLGVLGIDK